MRAEIQNESKGLRAEMQEGFETAKFDRLRIEHTLTDQINILAYGVIKDTNRLDRLEVKATNIEELIKE